MGGVPGRQPDRFQGWLGKRLIASFGWRYNFEDASFGPTTSIPDALLPLRERVARFAGLCDRSERRVSADTSAHGLARLPRLLSGLTRKPDLAIVEFGARSRRRESGAVTVAKRRAHCSPRVHQLGDQQRSPLLLQGRIGSAPEPTPHDEVAPVRRDGMRAGAHVAARPSSEASATGR